MLSCQQCVQLPEIVMLWEAHLETEWKTHRRKGKREALRLSLDWLSQQIKIAPQSINTCLRDRQIVPLRHIDIPMPHLIA